MMNINTKVYILITLISSGLIFSCKKDESQQRNSSSLFVKAYKIKSFMIMLKENEDENWGSKYSAYLIFKKLNRLDGIADIESKQLIYGQLPKTSDTIQYYNCIQKIKNYPQKKVIKLMSEKMVLKTWQCLSTQKENLIYFLPEPMLEKYKSKQELLNFIDENSITDEEANRIIENMSKE